MELQGNHPGCHTTVVNIAVHNWKRTPSVTNQSPRRMKMECAFSCVVVAGTDLRHSVWLCQYPARIKCPLHISLCIHHGDYDSSTPVRRRHLAGADAKDRYAIIRLVGMAGSIKSRHRGFCFSAPISPPLLFSA